MGEEEKKVSHVDVIVHYDDGDETGAQLFEDGVVHPNGGPIEPNCMEGMHKVFMREFRKPKRKKPVRKPRLENKKQKAARLKKAEAELEKKVDNTPQPDVEVKGEPVGEKPEGTPVEVKLPPLNTLPPIKK